MAARRGIPLDGLPAFELGPGQTRRGPRSTQGVPLLTPSAPIGSPALSPGVAAADPAGMALPRVDPQRRSPCRATALLRLVGLGIWLAAVCGGLALLMRYDSRAAQRGPIVLTWPTDTRLAFEPGRPNLLVFAHPRCPCTRATLENLAWEATRWPVQPRARVLLLVPEGADLTCASAFADTGLARRAEELPGFEIGFDLGGREAARFGARTSGEVLLFGPTGKLSFAGGLTPSRAHQGPCLGTLALRAALLDPLAEPRFSSVFGCALSAEDGVSPHPSTPARP